MTITESCLANFRDVINHFIHKNKKRNETELVDAKFSKIFYSYCNLFRLQKRSQKIENVTIKECRFKEIENELNI